MKRDDFSDLIIAQDEASFKPWLNTTQRDMPAWGNCHCKLWLFLSLKQEGLLFSDVGAI